jgi:hypothetical protein
LALQALSLDEAVWLNNFYLTNAPPLFLVETLADFGEDRREAVFPEQVVGGLVPKDALGRESLRETWTARPPNS